MLAEGMTGCTKCIYIFIYVIEMHTDKSVCP